MKLMGLCLTTTRVTELTEFYCRVLNVTSEGDEVHQQLHALGGELAIYNDGSVADIPAPNLYLTFQADNVDEEHRRLLDMGVEVIQPPTTQPWGMRNMIFRDLDSNRVVFRSKPKT